MTPNEMYVIGFNDKDPKVVWEVIDLYRNELLAYTRKLIYPRDNAEDILHDTYIRLMDSNFVANDMGHLKSALYLSLRNACINLMEHEKVIRRAHKNLAYLGLQPVNEAIVWYMKPEISEALLLEIASLPPQCRLIVEMRVLGFKSKDIAAKLRIKSKTVTAQLKIARSRLKLSPLLNQLRDE